jgi:hypothetical protein
LDEIYGWCRPAGAESPYEFRGSLIGRWQADQPGAGVPKRWFRTEDGWGGGWHDSDGVTLAVGAGPAPLTRASWRDKRGNTATIAFTGTGNAFLGTYQRVGEGAIGYRGHAPTPAKGE